MGNTPASAIDWVDLGSVPGLGGSGRDGGEGRGRLGVTSLAEVVRLGAADGVDDVLLLVEDPELAWYAPDLASVLSRSGVELHRHPIEDMGVPSEVAVLRSTLRDVTGRLAAGRSVVIACLGGRGRSGTVVACLLRDAGLDAASAIRVTREARRGAIETREQERFVEGWSRDGPGPNGPNGPTT